jgi:hypothetical protein
MNRRNLLKSLGALSAIATLPIVACSFSVKGVLNVLIAAVQGLLKVIPQSALSTNLSNALAALVQAEATWTSGGAAAVIIDALNTLEAVVAVIPFTAVYSPLIDVLVAGIESIINYFNPSSVPLKGAVGDPHRGRIALVHPHFLQTQQGAAKVQWNDACDATGLVSAKIA